MLKPRIEILPETTLVGKRLAMSFAAPKTQGLWQSFMPVLNTIHDRLGAELYSVEVYPEAQFFERFDPTREFEKWAAVRVTAVATVPAGMEPLVIPAGRYAVFSYRGKASEAPAAYQYIFGVWLPASDYRIDHRPHFAVMGANYRPDDPASEEELWIPVKEK